MIGTKYWAHDQNGPHNGLYLYNKGSCGIATIALHAPVEAPWDT